MYSPLFHPNRPHVTLSVLDNAENQRKKFPTPLLHLKTTGMKRIVWQVLSMEVKGTSFNSCLGSLSPNPTPLISLSNQLLSSSFPLLGTWEKGLV